MVILSNWLAKVATGVAKEATEKENDDAKSRCTEAEKRCSDLINAKMKLSKKNGLDKELTDVRKDYSELENISFEWECLSQVHDQYISDLRHTIVDLPIDEHAKDKLKVILALQEKYSIEVQPFVGEVDVKKSQVDGKKQRRNDATSDAYLPNGSTVNSKGDTEQNKQN